MAIQGDLTVEGRARICREEERECAILLRAARPRRDQGHFETKKLRHWEMEKLRNGENKEIQKSNSKEKRGFEHAELILSGKFSYEINGRRIY